MKTYRQFRKELNEAKSSIIGKMKDHIHADAIGKNRDGTYSFRRGYFYSHGYDEDKYANHVSSGLNNAGIKHTVIDKENNWAPFRGGASVRNSSHWHVKVKLHNDEAPPPTKEAPNPILGSGRHNMGFRKEHRELAELSQGTLRSYKKKATKELDWAQDRRWHHRFDGEYVSPREAEHAEKIAPRRSKGLDRAHKRIREENLDEISNQTLQSYIPKASKRLDAQQSIRDAHKRNKIGASYRWYDKEVAKRSRGIKRALDRVQGRAFDPKTKTFKRYTKESVDLEESVFDHTRYHWREHQGKTHYLPWRGGHLPLHPGDKFGMRRATSNEGKTRIVSKRHGLTRVFSLSHDEALPLWNGSKESTYE